MAVIDRRDIDFLCRWVGLGALLEREQFLGSSLEDADAIFTLAERIAAERLATHLRASDLTEPSLDAGGQVRVLPDVADGVRTVAEAGIFGAVFSQEHGGLQLPHLVYTVALGILMSGNLATASFTLLTVGNARLLTTYGNEAQIAAFAVPEIAGAAMGTMCLSEPHAGSSLGDIRTRAVWECEDALGSRFRLSGNKMWISGGDHDVTGNIIHLVLAKVPGANGELPTGTRGISLFIVPKILPDGEPNDIAVVGLNHKMGYRGLPNCALNFGEGRRNPGGKAGAIGWLVGQPGQGLPQMFHMMNEARTSVGLAAAMLACRGYIMSLDYARDRQQGRAIGASGQGPQIPIIEHADVKRMLLAQKAYSQGALGLVLFSARLLDDENTAETEAERSEAADLLSFLTPITKTWPSEWAQTSLHYALQIHGGAGYTRDFEIEQLYRDNRLNPIHEGTTGIHGLDLVNRKLRRENGRSFAILVRRIKETLARTPTGSELVGAAAAVSGALGEISSAVAILLGAPEDRALAHATPMLFALGHLVVGWLWLDQALFAEVSLRDGAPDRDFLAGRIRACRYFAEAELPLIGGWTKPIEASSDLVLSMPASEF